MLIFIALYCLQHSVKDLNDLGWVHGRKLTNQGNELFDIDATPGVAWEIGYATTVSVLGLALGIMGNFNSAANVYGLHLWLTIGFLK